MSAATAVSDAAPLAHEARIVEPVIEETVTDIDGDRAGDVEADVNASLLYRTRDAARAWTTAAEVEWRVTTRLGVALDLGFAGGAAAPGGETELFELQPALSYVILHDWSHDAHLQLEASGRARERFEDDDVGFEPGDPVLPFAIRLRSAFRPGRLALRPDVGASFGRRGSHPVPILLGLATLYALGDDRRSFVGVEIDVDGARRSPLLIAPEFSIAFAPETLLKLGVASPVVFDLDAKPTLAGGFVRLTVETD